jgi:tRNA threonylcarbamoyladenosine modification (KEOPS) complex Cgi121 subunit
MGFADMIVKSITGHNGLKIYVNINQVEINLNLDFQEILSIIGKIQEDFSNILLQFFNQKYILNSEHIINACYFVEKAFLSKSNISNKKLIELFLYLSTKRQIKQGLADFGLTVDNIKNRRVSYCIVSSEQNFDKINEIIKTRLNTVNLEVNLDKKSLEKYNSILNYFSISQNQINSVLRSYNQNPEEISDTYKIKALNDLICEKMALLSLEKP